MSNYRSRLVDARPAQWFISSYYSACPIHRCSKIGEAGEQTNEPSMSNQKKVPKREMENAKSAELL